MSTLPNEPQEDKVKQNNENYDSVLSKEKQRLKEYGEDVYFASKTSKTFWKDVVFLFHDNPKLILPAITRNPELFEIFNLKNVQDYPWMEEFEWITKDETLVSIYTNWKDFLLSFIHPEYLLKHKDFVLNEIKLNRRVYSKLPDVVKGDLEVAKVAVKEAGNNLMFVPQALREDEELVKLSCLHGPVGLIYAPQRFQEDLDYVRMALETDPSYLEVLIQKNRDLASNYDLVKPAVEKVPSLIGFIPCDAKRIPEYMEMVKFGILHGDPNLPELRSMRVEDSYLLFDDALLPSMVERKLFRLLKILHDDFPLVLSGQKEAIDRERKVKDYVSKLPKDEISLLWETFLASIERIDVNDGDKYSLHINLMVDFLEPFMDAYVSKKMLDETKEFMQKCSHYSIKLVIQSLAQERIENIYHRTRVINLSKCNNSSLKERKKLRKLFKVS